MHTHIQGLIYLLGSSQPSLDSQPLKYVTELTRQFRASDTTNEDIITCIEVSGALGLSVIIIITSVMHFVEELSPS